jgi:hypothetical protein
MESEMSEIIKYDQNKYNKRFQEKHKDKIKEKLDCPICYGTYTYFNKSKHNQSVRHKKALLAKKEEKVEVKEQPKIGNFKFPSMSMINDD